MTKYQFEAPDALWRKWKRTVPRDKNLDERIRELIEADAEGRVEADDQERRRPEPSEVVDDDQEREAAGTEPVAEIDQEAAAAALAGVAFPGNRDQEGCVEAVLAAREYLRAEGPASMREIVSDVMPEHSLGYEVPDLGPGDRFRGAWWRRVVKPGLEALDDVDAPEKGASDWVA